jgi:hypothetical protein
VPTIPVLRSLRQEDCKLETNLGSEFKASMGYTVRSCLKKKPKSAETERTVLVFGWEDS